MSSASSDAVRRWGLGVAAGLLLLGGCEREARRFGDVPAASTGPTVTRMSQLAAGTAVREAPSARRYEGNAYAIAEGKRLFSQFNCVGCHGHGGGAIGPALMDGAWIYGSEPENIFASIVQGRPNGMPAFGGRITPDQVWRLASYVRSMSGLIRKDVAPGRDDALQGPPQEQATTERPPQDQP
jgi:cytochrome c oxidase cbb3-type subunit 3